MTRNVFASTQFYRQYDKLIRKHRKKALSALTDVIDRLLIGESIQKYNPHPMKSNPDVYELHLDGDVLLAYYFSGNTLVIELSLLSIANHDELDNTVSKKNIRQLNMKRIPNATDAQSVLNPKFENKTEVSEMTDRELEKARAEFRDGVIARTGAKNFMDARKQMTEDEIKQNKEFDCIDMINSILAYGDFADAEDVLKYEEGNAYNYLDSYIKVLGRDRVKELIQAQMDDMAGVNTGVFTDSEGLTYNSIRWKDEESVHNEAFDINERIMTIAERRKFIELLTKGLVDMGYDREEANDIAIKRADALGPDWRYRHDGNVASEVRQQLILTEPKNIDEAAHRTDADEYSANEIVLYAENDRDIYFKHIIPTIDNLAKKMAKGEFDEELAKKGFIYPVNAAVKQYRQEFDAETIREYGFTFDVATRELAAAQLLSEFMDDIKDRAEALKKPEKK